jgi:hypothetical protein
MLHPTLEPQAAIEPVLSRQSACKACAGLEDDARLLGIDRHRPALLYHRSESVEEPSHQRIFPHKVISDLVAAARVPHVRGQKACPHFGQVQSGFFLVGIRLAKSL